MENSIADSSKSDFHSYGDCAWSDEIRTAESNLMFSTSLDAEPSVIEGGIYGYENDAVYPKFNDTDTSVEDDDYYGTGGTIVLSTTQPLRPYFKVNAYGVNQSWPISDTEYYTEPQPTETGYTSDAKISSEKRPRLPLGKVSTLLVAWNVLNMMMNMAILAMPFAVASGGIVSLAAIPVVGMMSGYSGKLLIDCMYEHSVRNPRSKRRIRLDYVDLGMDFINREIGGKVINALQLLDMLAACVLNINILGALCYEVLHDHLSRNVCSVIGVVFALPALFIKKPNCIAWMQVAAVTSLAIGLSMVQGYALSKITIWSMSKIPICDWEKLPISIGIIISAFSIHHALPGIEQQMSKPKQYRPMLVFTFSFAIIVKMFVGITNALFYGKSTDQVIIVDPDSNYQLGIASAVFIFISVLCSFALPTFVIMECIENSIASIFPVFRDNDTKSNICLSLLSRLLILAISMVFSILIPHFALLMAFFGNTLGTILSLTIPCLFHLKLKRDRLRWYHYVFNTTVIVLSIISMFIGVIFTCKELHKRLS
eukprot:gene3679-4196_t